MNKKKWCKIVEHEKFGDVLIRYDESEINADEESSNKYWEKIVDELVKSR